MSGKVRLVRGDTVTPQPIAWSWKHWIASGKFELLAGLKGAGKSSIAGDLEARITIGGVWPDGSPAGPPGSVLVWSSEDAFDDTILPRHIAAGGDPARLYHVAGIYNNGNGLDRYFDPAVDMQRLQEAVSGVPDLRMVRIDPVVSAVTGDGNTNTRVRQSLQPIVDFANELGCTALGITHFNKDSANKSILDRINGSLAYTAIARVVIGAAAGENGTPSRFVRVASNIAPVGEGFEYTLEQVMVPGHNFEAQRVVWGRALSGSPEDLMAGSRAASASTKTEQAMVWLLKLLQPGPMLQKDIDAARVGMGCNFSLETLRNAKDKLLIETKKTGDGWTWRLVDDLGKTQAA